MMLRRRLVVVPLVFVLSSVTPSQSAQSLFDSGQAWFDHDRVRQAVEAIGIHVVEDTAIRLNTPIGPLWVAGISDLWTGRHDLTAALAAVVDDGAPVLLLTHNPDVFPAVPARVTLTLAGHTHGGQVRLPFAGALIVPSRFGQRFAAGHVVEGGRHLFVATGIGTSILPVRFRVPPAVTFLTVRPAKHYNVTLASRVGMADR
jgi:predicted MPP superfamily phosphohydrolase